MDLKFDKIDNVNANLTISFVEDDYKNDVKKYLRQLSIEHPLKGFRPGHADMNMLQKRFGAEATSAVVDRLVSRALTDYIVNNKLAVLGEPMLDKDTRVDIVNNKEFSFTFNLGLAPEFDVTVDSTVAIPYYKVEATDKMIDDQDRQLRHRYGTQVAGEESAADSTVRGAVVELDAEGNPLEGGVTYERAVVMPQYVSDDEQKNLFIGLHVGDVITFNPYKASNGSPAEMAALLNIDRNDAEQHKGDFSFTVNEIMVRKDAELNDEFYSQAFGTGKVNNEQEYRDEIKKVIEAQLSNDSNFRFTIDARKVFMDQVGTLELPEEFLKRFLISRDEKHDVEKIEKELPANLKALRWQLVKEKIQQQLKAEVNDEELRHLARFYAAQQYAQYGINNVPEEMLNNFADRMLKDERTANDLHDRALDDKLYAAIKEAVTIDEKTVTVEEFNKLFESDKQED